MPRIPSIFEEELRRQAPARIDAAFLDRLTACAEGCHTDMAEEDVEFAGLLKSAAPRTLPSALQSSLLETVGETPFAVDGKIVLFHKQAKPPHAKPLTFHRFNIAAAAAVALLGAMAAFMVPAGKTDAPETADAEPATASPILETHVAPAGFGLDLSETRDEGVIWRGKNEPHRVIRLTYTDKVTLKNDKGETYQEERPRHEYVIIPEKID